MPRFQRGILLDVYELSGNRSGNQLDQPNGEAKRGNADHDVVVLVTLPGNGTPEQATVQLGEDYDFDRVDRA